MQRNRLWLFELLVLATFVSCSDSAGPASPTADAPLADAIPGIDSAPEELILPLTLSRISTTQFDVNITTDSLANFSISELTFQITGATASAWIQKATNVYVSTVTAAISSGEVPMSFRWKNYSATRTALIVKDVGSTWDQPEAVPGLVNTLGWEDSPEISADGKYLAVSTYSPVSLVCCIIGTTLNTVAPDICPGALGASVATNPSCNTNFYLENVLARPNFPGASRITSSTVINHIISLIVPTDTINAYPPVSSYVFEQQPAGSFANPVPVFVDWEAYTWGAPFGFHFKKNISNKKYLMTLAFGDPTLATGNHLQSAEMDFSQASVNLGTMSRINGSITKSNWTMTPLNIPALTTQAGNPSSYAAGGLAYLFWDDESLAEGQRDLYFATESSDGTFGTKQTIGLSVPGADEYQPYFFANRLYYSLKHQAIVSQELAVNADPASAIAWSSFQVDIEADPAQLLVPGGISAVGEPSLYQDSAGKKWLYFAYSVGSPSGLNLNIGRVSSK